MKSTWCIMCAHSLPRHSTDIPNLGNEIMCEALLGMVGEERSRKHPMDFLLPGSSSSTILPLNLARGLEFLNYQIRMK